MNRNEQISALLDGELSEAELKLLLADSESEDSLTFGHYGLVGDLIRSSEIARFHSPVLVKSIEDALANEPTVLAPTIATDQARKTLVQRMLAPARARLALASLMAVGFVSFALNQAVPPLENQVQMVRGQATENTFTDEELALWQEYFMAHQQNIIRGGLAGVSPLARMEADRPMLDNREHVLVTNSSAGEWMNVWEPSIGPADTPVQYNYVSSGR